MPSQGAQDLQQPKQALAEAMDDMPGSDALPAGKQAHKPTAPAGKAPKSARRAKTPITDLEASGPGGRFDVHPGRQELFATQHQEQVPANNSLAGAKCEALVATQAPLAASQITGTAFKKTRRAKEAAAVFGPEGASMAATAGQRSTALSAGQSRDTFPAIGESAVRHPAAAMLPDAPGAADSKESVHPAVPAMQTGAKSAAPILPHQNGTLNHSAEGPRSCCPPAPASGAVANIPGATQPAPAASNHHDTETPTGVSCDKATSAAVTVPASESGKTSAAAVGTAATAAQREGTGDASPEEGLERKGAEAAQVTQVQQQSPPEAEAAGAATVEAAAAAALAGGSPLAPLEVAAVQVSSPQLQASMHDVLISCYTRHHFHYFIYLSDDH